MESFSKCPPDKAAAIVKAGIQEFSQRTYTDANTDNITQTAGISKGLLFHYFRSKKEFYLFCLGVALDRLMANTPSPDSGDFFGILFSVMEEKFRLCRDFPDEMLFINLSARDSSAAINAEKQVIYARYLAKTTETSKQVLASAMASLPLRNPDDARLLDALSLYINAINQKFLLQYRETPLAYFEHEAQIQQEMKAYLSFMLNGVLTEGTTI